jgi:DNA-binding SARP family transcriptional activator/tetratricopeptide (TPR) repeat protein
MLQFGILGPLAVDRDGQPLAMPTGRARLLLGILIVHSGTPLSVDALIDMLWGDQPPRTAATALHGHVSRLRKVLGDHAVRTTPAGYLLAVGADAVDSARFRTTVDQARREHDAAARSRLLRGALGLWRGPALADFCYEPFAQPIISTFEEMRVTATEDAIEADLAAGLHTALVEELQPLVLQHPLRERLWGYLMIALYRCGRQAEALATYHAARQRMADELGVEPGPSLRTLESAILRQDAALVAPTMLPEHGATPPRVLVRPRANRSDAVFVGRDAELHQLDAILHGVTDSRRPAVVTVIGEPGVGKSRLISEFASRVRDRVTVLNGQCQPDVEATYAPVHQLLSQTPVDTDDPASRLAARLREALAGGHAVAGRMIDSAAASFFAAVAERRPVVMVLEDIHWAQPALLDLVEAIAMRPEAAVMTVCLARPELSDRRPLFGSGAVGAVTIDLPPLSAAEVRRVVLDVAEPGASAEAVEEIVSVSEGNPLFALQLVASAGDGRGPTPSIPPAVRALLANRISGLAPGELAVAHCAAIVGRDFTGEAVTALLPADAQRGTVQHLAALERRQLVVPTGDGYRFRHDLIRRTAYMAMDPGLRAHLHEQHADWLSANDAADPSSADETVGYHLESARDNLLVLGEHDEHVRLLGVRAAGHFAAAGHRASGRRDMPGAATLLTRAVRLLPPGDRQRPSLMVDACFPLRTSGRTQEAMTTAMAAIELARAAGDVAIEWRARLELVFVRASLLNDRTFDEGLPVAEMAVAVLNPLRADQGLAFAWVIIGQAREAKGELIAAGAAYRQALHHARLISTFANAGQIAWGLAIGLLEGPTPVPEAIARCRKLVDWRGQTIPGVLLELAHMHALNAEIGEARAVLARAARIYREWGHRRGPIFHAYAQARVELAAGDASAAETQARRGLELGASVGGDETDGANALALAEALCRQGRLEEVEDVVRTYAGATPDDEIGRAAAWNAVRAEIRMHRGAWADAVELATRAVAAVDGSDFFTLRAELRLTLAAALHGSGDVEGARRVAADAIVLFEAKANATGLARARDYARHNNSRMKDLNVQ